MYQLRAGSILLLKYPAVKVLNQNSSQMILRFHHKSALFSMTFLSMLGDGNGEGGLGGGWELMAQWFDVSWTPYQ